MDALPLEFAVRVSEAPQGANIEIWHGPELVAVHWGVDLDAATTSAGVAAATYLAQTD